MAFIQQLLKLWDEYFIGDRNRLHAYIFVTFVKERRAASSSGLHLKWNRGARIAIADTVLQIFSYKGLSQSMLDVDVNSVAKAFNGGSRRMIFSGYCSSFTKAPIGTCLFL